MKRDMLCRTPGPGGRWVRPKRRHVPHMSCGVEWTGLIISLVGRTVRKASIKETITPVHSTYMSSLWLDAP